MATGVTSRRAIELLSAPPGCEATEEAVFARRRAPPPADYAASLLRTSLTDMLLVDEGFPPADVSTSWQELGDLAGCGAKPILRIEATPLDAVGDVVTGARRAAHSP